MGQKQWITKYALYMLSGNVKIVSLTETQKSDLDYCITNKTVFAYKLDFIVARYITEIKFIESEVQE